MKLKHFFIINAIIALLYAFGELLVPEFLLSLYTGGEPTDESIIVARFFGWGLLAVGLICAFAANTPTSETKRAIVKGLFVAGIVGFIVSLNGVLSGTLNAFGWSPVIIYVFLVSGYGYFWFVKPETA